MIKIGAEAILTAIVVPILATFLFWIVDLKRADAVQETRLEQLLKITEEIRVDVKELREKKEYKK